MDSSQSSLSPSVEMLRKLIAFPTVSRDSNLALIHFVRDTLKPYDADIRLTHDDEKRKANLFATLGPRGEPGIVLSGHTDVVPVEGQAWDTDPFVMVEKGGKLYGRGTCDMKGFVACVLALVPEVMKRGLKSPLHLAFSYDEEVGCIGVGRLISDLQRAGIKPKSCIVGEPTEMRSVVAHKGKKAWRCRVRGHEAHSSLTPQGVNAVQIACDIVSFIADRARAFRSGHRQDPAYDVPFTTPHVGVIRGGTALNIVPRDCMFEFEIRHLPFDDPDAFFADVERYAQSLLPAMRAVAPDTHIEFDLLSTLPGFDDDGRNAIADIGRACSGAHGTHKVSFGSEAALFNNASMPAIICGPGHIEQAHQPNEWVSLEQLAGCEAFMERLAQHLCVA